MTLHHNRYDVPVQLLVDKMLGKMNRDFEKNSKRYSFLMGQIQLQSGTPKLRFYLIFGRKIIPTRLIQQILPHGPSQIQEKDLKLEPNVGTATNSYLTLLSNYLTCWRVSNPGRYL